jgi:hypothetical protein
MARHHALRIGLRGEERAGQVDREHLGELVRLDLEGRRRPKDARHEGDPFGVSGRLHETPDGSRLRDVDCERFGLVAAGADLGGNLLGEREMAVRKDDAAGPFKRGQVPRDVGADSLGGANDHCRFGHCSSVRGQAVSSHDGAVVEFVIRKIASPTGS